MGVSNPTAAANALSAALVALTSIVSRVAANTVMTLQSSLSSIGGINPITLLKYSLLTVHPYPSSLITSEGDAEPERRDTMSLIVYFFCVLSSMQ